MSEVREIALRALSEIAQDIDGKRWAMTDDDAVAFAILMMREGALRVATTIDADGSIASSSYADRIRAEADAILKDG